MKIDALYQTHSEFFHRNDGAVVAAATAVVEVSCFL
jgi:hypothetical protein